MSDKKLYQLVKLLATMAAWLATGNAYTKGIEYTLVYRLVHQMARVMPVPRNDDSSDIPF